MNTDVAFFGLGVLCFLTVWRRVVRISILDEYRDRLAELAMQVDHFFWNRGDSENQEAKRKFLTDQIRSSIFFLRKASFTRAIAMNFLLARKPALMRAVRRDIDERFWSSDTEITRYCYETRDKAARLVRDYIFYSSLVGLLCVAVYWVIASLSDLFSKVPARQEQTVFTDPRLKIVRRHMENVLSNDQISAQKRAQIVRNSVIAAAESDPYSGPSHFLVARWTG